MTGQCFVMGHNAMHHNDLQHREFDAVVVGGGIVGAVQALLLGQHGISVLLIDAARVEGQSAPLQQRSVALSHRSFELLQSAGLWPADSVCTISEIQVTNRGSFGSVRITADDLNSDALGYVVANHSFEQHLRCLLKSQQNIEVLQPATATLEHHSDSGARLRVSAIDCDSAQSPPLPLVAAAETASETVAESAAETVAPDNADDGAKHVAVEHVAAQGELTDENDKASLPPADFIAHCRVLIAADGTHSQIRQGLGLGLRQQDYDQVAVVANVECQLDHRQVAYERFTDSGPLALLPLADRCMAMVYTARAADAESLNAMGDGEFLQLLQQRFGGNLGRFRQIGLRALFPLVLSESESQAVGCCVLIGNSARTLHPVAGQGLNLALRDVFALTARVAPALQTAAGTEQDLAPEDPIDWSMLLADFQRQRRSDQKKTVRRTDLLARLFSDDRIPGSGMLRGAGLLLLNGFAPVRKRFAEDSAGIGVPLGHGRGNHRENKVE